MRLKKELPTAKRVRSASFRLAAGKENALRPLEYTVVLPPGKASASGGANSCEGVLLLLELESLDCCAEHPAKIKAEASSVM